MSVNRLTGKNSAVTSPNTPSDSENTAAQRGARPSSACADADADAEVEVEVEVECVEEAAEDAASSDGTGPVRDASSAAVQEVEEVEDTVKTLKCCWSRMLGL